jgi:hypothetical protein
MNIPRKVPLFAVAAAALAVIISAAPVAAYKHLGTRGTTGTHSLTDTADKPGATCKYRQNAEGEEILRRVEVRPPNADASTLEGNQEVGWKFEVKRRVHCLCDDPIGDWEDRYTSPIQKVRTDWNVDAPFTWMGVRVLLPNETNSDLYYEYRVIIKAIWYRDDGRVTGSARMRVEWFKSDFDDMSTQHKSCVSWQT